jgi:hypothetical protein
MFHKCSINSLQAVQRELKSRNCISTQYRFYTDSLDERDFFLSILKGTGQGGGTSSTEIGRCLDSMMTASSGNRSGAEF